MPMIGFRLPNVSSSICGLLPVLFATRNRNCRLGIEQPDLRDIDVKALDTSDRRSVIPIEPRGELLPCQALYREHEDDLRAERLQRHNFTFHRLPRRIELLLMQIFRADAEDDRAPKTRSTVL